MRAGRKKRQDDAPGADSFLDIIANLVGILIILITVIGVRAKDAAVEAATTAVAAPVVEDIDEKVVEQAKQAVEAVEKDINQLDQKRQMNERALALRTAERDRLNALVIQAERQIDQRREQLDLAAKEKFDLATALSQAKRELDALKSREQAAEEYTPPPEVIEHLPTPMAKTVFGIEEHFRLLGGRLAYVPLNTFVERLKSEARQKIWKLKDAQSVTETIGPLRGFRMRYTLKRVEHAVAMQAGTQIRQRVELDHFVLTPVADNLGEPLDAALRPGSDFRQRLDGMDRKRTTITVWVYADSFDQFRHLKQELFKMGYVTAGRPLPMGSPIGGSPNGTRSASQ